MNEKGILSHSQKQKLDKAKTRLAKGKEDPKFHTYRKKDVFAFNEKYLHDVIRPFFHATADEVIYFSLNRGFKINPLYFLGSKTILIPYRKLKIVNTIQDRHFSNPIMFLRDTGRTLTLNQKRK